MYTPHQTTLYRLTEHADGTVEVDITLLHTVMLQRSEGARASTQGLTGEDAATLFIPFDCEATDGLTQAGKTYASPKEYEAAADKTGLFTIADDGKSYFVLGAHIEQGATFARLNAMYDDVYKVTDIRVCDYGSPSMRHFEVSGA